MKKTTLTAPQAKRLAHIERGFATRIPVKRGAFKSLDQRLLMGKLIWYTLQKWTSQTLYAGDGKVHHERVLRLTAKGRKALKQYRSTH